MKRFICLLLLAFMAGTVAVAQDNPLIKEIDEQVWKPFMRSFSNDDNKGFRAVHSKEMVRVIQDSKDIFGYDQYFKELPDSIKARSSDWKKTIELRFVQRIAKNDKAFDVGYYKTSYINTKTGETRKGIGKFHVLLRKENGVWKILMDADSAEGATEEVFNKAIPIQ